MKKTPIKNLAQNVALMLASTLLFLIVVEGFFRVRAYISESALYEKKVEFEEILSKYGYLTQEVAGAKVRPSKYEGIFFEMIPLESWQYLGHKVSINSAGFRDKEYAVTKDPHTVRVFGIGDSIMFGQGVHQEDNYLSVLERELNRLYKGKRWEVINSGVSDYNTWAEVLTLRHKGLKYRPDIVILGMCSNDLDIPVYAMHKGLPDKRLIDKYFSFRHSFTHMFIRHKLGLETLDIPGIKHKYLKNSGSAGVKSAFKELRLLSYLEGFEVIVVNLAFDTDVRTKDIIRLANAFGFPVLELSPVIKKYMSNKGIKDYFDSEMTVSDGHPSAIGHQIAADALLDYMDRSGLIGKLESK